MSRNGHFSLESAWNEIAKVKNQYNQQKLIELYQKAAPFITKYQDCDVETLTTQQFAKDYLPLLRLILQQSAGKKLLVSYIANPWIGITKSITWFIWLPTKVGSHAAMTVLKSYVDDLELQAADDLMLSAVDKYKHVSTQTDILVSESDSLPDLVPPTDDPVDLVSPSVDHADSNKTNTNHDLVPSQSDHLLVPNIGTADSAIDVDQSAVTTAATDLNVTSGVGCGPDGKEWISSEGELEDIMAQFVHKTKIADETPDRPQLNSTLPSATPRNSSSRRPSGPRKLTKGSRRQSFKDSGVNLTATGAWENSRRPAEQPAEQPVPALKEKSVGEVQEIDLTDAEIIDFENGEEEVFSDESFVEIPDLEGSE